MYVEMYGISFPSLLVVAYDKSRFCWFHQKTEDRTTEKRHEQKWKSDEFSPQKGNTLCLMILKK